MNRIVCYCLLVGASGCAPLASMQTPPAACSSAQELREYADCDDGAEAEAACLNALDMLKKCSP